MITDKWFCVISSDSFVKTTAGWGGSVSRIGKRCGKRRGYCGEGGRGAVGAVKDYFVSR